MKKGQAALFDSIMFLLFVSGSIAMMYQFFTAYGVAQDKTMRSAYVLAYAQDIGKSVYYVNAGSLSKIADAPADPDLYWRDIDFSAGSCPPGTATAGCPYSDLAQTSVAGRPGVWGCKYLEKFGQLTVLELLKYDLVGAQRGSTTWDTTGGYSGVTSSYTLDACLDNKLGKANGKACVPYDSIAAPDAPGKLALRCAMMQVMKPFQAAGYRYFVDVVRADVTSSVRQPAFNLNDYSTWRVSNAWQANVGTGWMSCDDAKLAGNDILTVGFPFRVPDAVDITKSVPFEVKICLWQSRQNRG